jgi:hypothetical protein
VGGGEPVDPLRREGLLCVRAAKYSSRYPRIGESLDSYILLCKASCGPRSRRNRRSRHRQVVTDGASRMRSVRSWAGPPGSEDWEAFIEASGGRDMYRLIENLGEHEQGLLPRGSASATATR